MAELAKHIAVTQRVGDKPGSLKVDGREFPWYTTDAVITRIEPARREEQGVTSLATVTVTIPCERFELADPWPQKPARSEGQEHEQVPG